ncbi:MAG: hypothetical protein MUC47_00915 [Candidatus Kapabacteria bacterium]|jgi:DNA-binding CsgD family transcriptional regulator|nr:hypothetical protein [Candidatus Kapabacteria bacterium]
MVAQPFPHAHHSPITDRTSSMLRDMRLTTLLRSIHDALQPLAMDPAMPHKSIIGRILRDINEHLDEQQMWQDFVAQFDAIHGNFISKLAQDYPTLTPTELRLCAFLRLPMPSKDIATLYHCSVRSIEKHRERMRKKFGLRPNESLTTFLASRER